MLQQINLKDMVAWKDGNRRVMELRIKATKHTFRTHDIVWMKALVKGLGLPADTDKVKVVKDNDGKRFLYSMDTELDAQGIEDTINKGIEDTLKANKEEAAKAKDEATPKVKRSSKGKEAAKASRK